MDSRIILSLGDVGWIVLWVLGCIALIFLIMILRSLYQTTQLLKEALIENRAQVDATLEHLPDLTQNVSRVSHEAASFMETLHSLGDLVSTVEPIANMVSKIKANKSAENEGTPPSDVE